VFGIPPTVDVPRSLNEQQLTRERKVLHRRKASSAQIGAEIDRLREADRDPHRVRLSVSPD
jgi:hypothetical protein